MSPFARIDPRSMLWGWNRWDEVRGRCPGGDILSLEGSVQFHEMEKGNLFQEETHKNEGCSILGQSRVPHHSH